MPDPDAVPGLEPTPGPDPTEQLPRSHHPAAAASHRQALPPGSSGDTLAVVVGIAGPVLGEAEAALLRARPPAGVMLFGRNVSDPAQLARLVGQLRAVLPAQAVLLVDQEGGRVARLRPPHWTGHPPAGRIGALRAPGAAARAAWLTGALIGLDLRGAGLDVACAPVLDLQVPGAHDVIGDRAFSADPQLVAALGRALADGLLAAGVQPLGKHAPGHGRAVVDSHLCLPQVEGVSDAELLPFRALSDLPWMMTAHVRYPAWDCVLPATLSSRVIGTVLRGTLGLDGVLVSDDLAMGALSGLPGLASPAARAVAALAAGCDLALFCPGALADNQAVLAAAPALSAQARDRLERARRLAESRRTALDARALLDERDALLAGETA